MNSTQVPIEVIAEVLGARDKVFEEVRMVFVAVGLLNLHRGEYICN